MEVLDEDEGRLRSHFLEHGVREELVDLSIRLPVARLEAGAREGDVAERPKTAIGEAVVVALFLLGAEPDPAEGVARVFRRNSDAVVLVDHFTIGVAATVTHPGSVAGQHDRVECRRHATGRPNHLQFVARVLVDEGFSIRHDDETVSLIFLRNFDAILMKLALAQ